MNKKYLKLIIIIFLSIMFVFIFPCNKKYGYNSHNADDGPDVSDPRYKWHFTRYADSEDDGVRINKSCNK